MRPHSFGSESLGPADVGSRVVVRHQLPSGLATDVLGELVSARGGALVVRRADGAEVRIGMAAVRAAKRVPPGPVRIRPARLADAEAIETLRIGCWGSAYRGMIPDTYLDALPGSLAAGVARRRWLLADTVPGVRQLVADAGGAVVGWAGFGPARDPDRDARSAGEVYACYVAQHWTGYGLGGRLLRRGLGELAADGLTEVSVWVLADNAAALRFYATHGFAPDGSRLTLDLGGPVAEIRCVRLGIPR